MSSCSQEARAAHNVFHPLTYADAVAAAATGSCCPTKTQEDTFSPGVCRLLQQLSPVVRNVQLQEFGQTPIKLFSQPHPMRSAAAAVANVFLLLLLLQQLNALWADPPAAAAVAALWLPLLLEALLMPLLLLLLLQAVVSSVRPV